MSSVLKALKQQSSPLLQARSEVSLRSAAQPSQRLGYWMMILVGVAAAAVSCYFTFIWLQSTAPDGAEQPSVTTVTDISPPVTYTLGAIEPIIVPQWPQPSSAPPVSTESGSAVVSSAEQQAETQIVNDNQAIDLNQVSPQLLSAFENALSDGGENRSVVPVLADLSLNFQRLVPSFSYDGHQYSSRAEARWVELAGVRLFEGERWQGITVLTIAPAHVVLSRNNQAFQQPALEDWTTP